MLRIHVQTRLDIVPGSPSRTGSTGTRVICNEPSEHCLPVLYYLSAGHEGINSICIMQQNFFICKGALVNGKQMTKLIIR